MIEERNMAITSPTPADARRAAVAQLAKGERGMTLIEIMVVMAIIGLIGVVVAVNVGGSQKEAEIMATHTLVGSTIPGALDAYRATRREYPESLEVLVELKRLRKNQLVDAWLRPLSYEVTSDGFRLCSGGPDKQPGNNDDICNTDE
jgi:general secretion pathway protein G